MEMIGVIVVYSSYWRTVGDSVGALWLYRMFSFSDCLSPVLKNKGFFSSLEICRPICKCNIVVVRTGKLSNFGARSKVH